VPPTGNALELAALGAFAEALERPAAEREAWLAAACAGDPALFAKVHRLLAIDDVRASGFESLGFTHAGGALPAEALLPPPRIGSWRLEELIGAGGMGSVYRARRDDGLFEQTVAVKFIRPMNGAVRVEALIDAERQLLARMEHPGIARILDGGTTAEGLHYLVMEYISGVPLDDFVRDHALDERGRLGLLREITAAVAHAHQHLVLHCDLKPANVLVTREGRPRLIDFGVARIQDVVDVALPDGFTRAYTSPQRLAGEPPAVTDDIYSLGIMLREILTGRAADDADSGESTGNPAPARAAALSSELEATIAKATARDRDLRYPSCLALGDDLTAYLEKRPLAAVGRAWRYRLRKLIERRPWRVAAAAAAFLGLVTALAVTASLYHRAEAARLDAEKRFAEVRSLANYMLFDLDSKLEAAPGNTSARRDMVGRSQRYLDALAATANSNLELQREIAIGLTKLAEVQGVPGRAHVGEQAAAKRSLERAESMLESLTRSDGARMDWLRDLGRTRYLLAIVYGGVDNDSERQITKARESETALQRALDSAPAWRPALAELAEMHTLLASARVTAADALRAQAKFAEAADIQTSEERRLMELPGPTKAAMEFDYHSGRIPMLLGDSLYDLGRIEEALASYRRGTQRMERGLVTHPSHRRLLQGTVIGYWNIAGTLEELGRPGEALAEIEKAVPIAERAVSLDPQNVEAQRYRTMVRDQRALLLGRLGRPAEAIRLIEVGLAEREQRALASPDSAEAVRGVAVPLRNLARLYRDRGDTAGACSVLRGAVDAWEAVDRRWPLSERDRVTELEVARQELARCRG
jgi:serine/threonine protein kinase